MIIANDNILQIIPKHVSSQPCDQGDQRNVNTYIHTYRRTPSREQKPNMFSCSMLLVYGFGCFPCLFACLLAYFILCLACLLVCLLAWLFACLACLLACLACLIVWWPCLLAYLFVACSHCLRARFNFIDLLQIFMYFNCFSLNFINCLLIFIVFNLCSWIFQRFPVDVH